MKLSKAAKNWRVEKIADEFLKFLSGKNADGRLSLLNNFLDEKNVYYEVHILTEVLQLLLDKKLITDVPNSLAVISYFEPEENAEPGRIMHPSKWLGGVEGAIQQSEITPKGRHFVSKGQRLDIAGIAEAKAKRDKWIERGITFLITVATAVVVTWFSEPVKQWWADRRKPLKSESINASSPVRPRLDGRQRPESRKSDSTTAPRSGARR